MASSGFRIALGLLALVAGAEVLAQSHGSAPVPVAKAEARVEFVTALAELPPLVLALPPVDPAEIAVAKLVNTRADTKRLQIGVGRSTFGQDGADGAALAWRAVDGGMAARWDVISPGAAALRVELTGQALPEGFELRFSGQGDPGTVYGPITASDFDAATATLWSPVLIGEHATIELFVPRGVRLPALAIAHVSHLFVSPVEGHVRSLAKTGESGACEIDLVCQTPGNAALASIGKSVARMTFTDGASTFLCSGTLVGSTDGTSTPYFYSAAHCIGTQVVANTLTTHWFFDRTACGSGSTSGNYVQRTGGAALLHANPDSDVLLLRLNNAPPAGAWFAGWDASALANGSAVTGVHHPRGDWKKVSLGSKTADATGFGPSGSFSEVHWTSGVTEGGSSGSAIFTAIGSPATDYRLRGGLYGGLSACGAPPSDLYDFYSRLDLAYPSIKQWIDPPPTGMILTVTRVGNGVVTSAPAGMNCGADCTAGFAPNTVVTLTAAASAGSRFNGWSGACTGLAPCTLTMNAARSVTATFAATPQPRLLDVSTSSVDFGAQSMGTTSPATTIQIVNVGASPVTFGTLGTSGPFGASSTCTTLAPGAACGVGATFQPAVQAGLLDTTSPASGSLSIASDAAGSPAVVTLAGLAEKSLVSHYYRSILRRAPDPQGHAFWRAESLRAAALGANVNEAWYAMAMAFFGSPEYASFNRSDAEFVTDLYRTFFNRAPDGGGLTFWNQELFNGLPRGVALSSFMFSPEFTGFAQGIFGNTAVRPEIDTVTDFYRGFLSRLPDSGGFNYWLQRFRVAQCQGAAAVLAEAEAISAAFANGGEYAGRARTNSQFVGDLYNAFLRRGGDIGGVQFWINNLLVQTKTREGERREFLASPEFAARVTAIAAAGCSS